MTPVINSDDQLLATWRDICATPIPFTQHSLFHAANSHTTTNDNLYENNGEREPVLSSIGSPAVTDRSQDNDIETITSSYISDETR